MKPSALRLAVLFLALGARMAGGQSTEKIAFFSALTFEAELRLGVMNADGTNAVNLLDNTGNFLANNAATPITWAPDGTSIAVALTDETGQSDIWVVDIGDSRKTNLTGDEWRDGYPAWSPDGTKIAFVSDRNGGDQARGIYTMSPDGTDIAALGENGVPGDAPAWSPDGSRIVFERLDAGTNYDLYTVDADGENLIRLTNTSPQRERLASWSPDGTRIAFIREASASAYAVDLVGISADGADEVVLVANGSQNLFPNWSPDGSQLAFVSDMSGGLHIHVMDADGSNISQLTSGDTWHLFPSWSPVLPWSAVGGVSWGQVKLDLRLWGAR